MAFYSWDAILSHVAHSLTEAVGTTVKVSDLVLPPKPDMGDLAYGCFAVAKVMGSNPAEEAKKIVSKFKDGDHVIESVEVAGPYVNIKLKVGELVNRVVQDVENGGEEYGSSSEGKKQEVMLEYAQPNTHKEIHVGHLRNLLIGVSLDRLLKMNGWKVITASYHGDVGAHVAKCLWLMVRANSSTVAQSEPKKSKKSKEVFVPMKDDEWADFLIKNLDPMAAGKILESMSRAGKSGVVLGRYYSESTKLLEENPHWKEQVSLVQQKLEAKDKAWMQIWQETRRWSLAEFSEIFQNFGVKIDRQYFESEVMDEGQKIVDNLLKKKVACLSQGAVIVDLEEKKLGAFLIRKSDGTALYATKDLPLAYLKAKEFPKLKLSLLLVDNRQELYFKQLFATLELMGYKVPTRHIGYEFVTLKSGAMSSREGNIVTMESFEKEVVNYARRETLKRHEDWNAGRVEHVAWCLAMGGIKYGMLKQDSEKVLVFDLEKAMSFDGDTGPYVQYAATRINSILKKAAWRPDDQAGDLMLLSEPAEKALAMQMAVFPSFSSRAAREMRPSVVAQWCLSMAQKIMDFYRDVPVLDAPFGVKQARLRLLQATHRVMEQALDLLGIPLPDEM